MSALPNSPFRRTLRLLTLTSAVSGLAATFPVAAQTVTLPGAQLPGGSGAPTINTPGNNVSGTLTVRLNTKNTIINWDGFNVPKDATADFKDNRSLTGGFGGRMAVLNRDMNTSGAPSQLLGNIASDRNVAVWVLNPNGILVGRDATISTGALVLSTLDVENPDFLDDDSTYSFKGAAGSQSAITVREGAEITVGVGGSFLDTFKYSDRGLVMVAPKIEANGTFNAANSGQEQNIAFVTASDATLTYGDPDSPLSVTMNRGTVVPGSSQIIAGTVKGRNVLFAVATQGSVADALLQVKADVTIATSGARGIVLSAGASTTPIDGVTLAGDADTVGGIVNLSVEGKLATNDGGGDILAGASGTASFMKDLSSKRDIALAGDGATLVEGAVAAGRNYAVSGATVKLGKGTAGAIIQKANGKVDITAVEAITGLAGLTLQSNANGGTGNNAEPLTLTLSSQGGGTLAFAPETTVLGGTNKQSAVAVKAAVATASVTMGDVRAHDLQGAIGADSLANAIQTTGAFSVGDVSVSGDISLSGTSFTGGKLTSDQGAIKLITTAGALTTKDLQAKGAIDLGSADLLTTGLINGGSSVGASAVGALTVGNVTAVNDVSITSASISANKLISDQGAIALTSTGGALVAGDLTADRVVTLKSADVLKLNAVDGGDFNASAVGMATVSGDLVSRGDLILRAGAIRLDGSNATSRGIIDFAASAGGVAGKSGFRIASSSSDVADFVRLQAVGPEGISFPGTSAIIGGDNRALRVATYTTDAAAPIVLGDVSARALIGLSAFDGDLASMGAPIVSGGSLAFGNLDLVESFAARSTGGNLAVGSINVSGTGQGILLEASVGTLTAQTTVTASGDVTLAGGGALTFDRVESTQGTASVTSGGALTLTTLAGAMGATASGSSLKIGTVTGGLVNLGSTAGDVALGSVTGKGVTMAATGGRLTVTNGVTSSAGIMATATGDLNIGGAATANGGAATMTAGGALSLLGGGFSTGAYTATGQSVTLGGQHKANGAIAITATAGALTGRSGSSIVGDADGVGGEAITLAATGGAINLGTTNITGTKSAVTATTDTGLIKLGNVTARSLSLSGVDAAPESITTGDLQLTESFVANARLGVTTGQIGVSAGTVTVDGGTGAVKVGQVNANGAVNLTGGSIGYGGITGGATSLVASAGDVRGGDITAQGPLTVSALAGSIGLGSVRSIGAGGDVNLTSLGTLAVNSVDAGGGAVLTTTQSPTGADIVIANGLTAVDAVAVTSSRDISARSLTSTTGTLTVSAPNGQLIGIGSSGAGLKAGPGKLLSITVRDSVDLAELTAGPISITAGAITIGRVSAGNQAVTLAASNGDLRINGPVVAGDATFTATGGTYLQSVTASGALTLGGRTGLRFGDISAASITATSGGAIVGNAARANGALSISGGDVSLGNARAGTDLTIAATRGDALLGALSAAGNVAVTAAGKAQVGGDVTAGGNYQVTGSEVVLGTQAARQQAGGTIAVKSTAGDISGASGLVLSNLEPNGSKTLLTLDAVGGIALGGSRIDTASLGLKAGEGNTVTLGAVNADVIGGLENGAVGGSFVHSGNVVTGDVVTRDIAITLNGGDLTMGAVTASGDAKLSTAAGALSARGVSGVTVNLAASGQLSVGAVEASSAVTASGEAIAANTIRGSSIVLRTPGALGGLNGGAATLTATAGGITATTGEAKLGAVTASGNVNLSSSAGLAAQSVNGAAVRLAAENTLSAGKVDADGAVSASGGTIATDTIRGASIVLRTPGALGGLNGGAATLTATGGAITATTGEAKLGAVAAAGDVSLSSSAGLIAQSVKGAAIALGATNALSATMVEGTGPVTARGGSILADSIRGGTITVSTAGNLNGVNGGRTALAATAGDVTVGAGTARLAAVSAPGGISLNTASLDATGAIAAGRQLSITSAGVINMADGSAAGDVTLMAGDTVNAGGLSAGGAVSVNGANILLSSARAGGALKLTSSRDVQLGSGQAGGAAAIDAKGLVTLGALSAGPSLTVKAADAQLNGTQSAATVTFQNSAAANSAMWVGDGAGSGGFQLSNAEVGLVKANSLRFDQGSGALEIGTVTFGADSGRSSVELMTAGAATVSGIVTGSGVGRNFRIGGGADGSMATSLRVRANTSAGGRLLVGDANLDLRATSIAIGLDPQFLELLTPDAAGRAQAMAFITNGNSALYNAALGGVVYDPAANTIVSARSLRLNFTDFALIQNTAVPGRFSGVVLGGTPTMPALPALTVRSNGAAGQSSFALFGTINGVGGPAAALLGSSVIDITPGLLPNSRINGCLAGSGAGCLTTIVIQPVLQIFNWNSEDVFGVAQDVSTPFAPMIGGNNEELLTGLPALSPEGGPPPIPVPVPTPDAAAGSIPAAGADADADADAGATPATGAETDR